VIGGHPGLGQLDCSGAHLAQRPVPVLRVGAEVSPIHPPIAGLSVAQRRGVLRCSQRSASNVPASSCSKTGPIPRHGRRGFAWPLLQAASHGRPLLAQAPCCPKQTGPGPLRSLVGALPGELLTGLGEADRRVTAVSSCRPALEQLAVAGRLVRPFSGSAISVLG